MILTRYPFFKAEAVTKDARFAEITGIAQQIQAANHVLVVGGRSVGVEFVGEIINTWPNKEVTIVHPMDNLMDMWPKSGIKRLNKYLGERKNVHIVLQKKVVRSEGTQHELSDGTMVEGTFNRTYLFSILNIDAADFKILATGVQPNSESLQQFFGAALSPAGYVKVRKTLQLEGNDNIFALGDIADLDMPKV